MTATRYAPGPNPHQLLAGLLRAAGIETSAGQLEVQSAALAERRRVDDRNDIQAVRDLASAVRKARRDAQTAETLWQLSPSGERRQAVLEAYAERDAAYAELSEALLHDSALVSAAIESVS